MFWITKFGCKKIIKLIFLIHKTINHKFFVDHISYIFSQSIDKLLGTLRWPAKSNELCEIGQQIWKLMELNIQAIF